MEDKLIVIENKLITIENKVACLETTLDKILSLLENNVSKNCEKMENHIDFIETVYDNVKHPLQFICNKLNKSNDTIHNNNNILAIETSSKINNNNNNK